MIKFVSYLGFIILMTSCFFNIYTHSSTGGVSSHKTLLKGRTFRKDVFIGKNDDLIRGLYVSEEVYFRKELNIESLDELRKKIKAQKRFSRKNYLLQCHSLIDSVSFEGLYVLFKKYDWKRGNNIYIPVLYYKDVFYPNIYAFKGEYFDKKDSLKISLLCDDFLEEFDESNKSEDLPILLKKYNYGSFTIYKNAKR